ncbi:MAG: glycosyltransferase family 4 protein [Crocinitomicaceae bacterium]|nr:glycosyltransferase family 4 protein [Crocinitomicaceae bacterium]MBK8925388.1 glycosyltransferase family 4 protein [Crocinitomicaceae bacterium]
MKSSSTQRLAFLITSTGWGGLEMNVLKLGTELKQRGFSILLISQEKSTIYQRKENVFDDTLLISFRKKYFDFKTAKQIATELKKKSISQIVVFDNRDLDVLSWAKRCYFNKLKIVYQQHMQIGINKKSFFHTLRYKSIHTWISPLQYLKDEVALRTKFPVARVRVIPIGLDTARFANNAISQQEARSILGINTSFPLLGIIGRISEKKGQLFLAESVKKINENGIRVNLLIFGSATINDPDCVVYDQKLHQFVEENKLQQQVFFVPHRSDTELFYAASDIFVLASHSETYGMVTLEALCSGLPVIATTSGGTSEILEQGTAGELYHYENYTELKAAVEKIIGDLSQSKLKANSQKEKFARLYTTKNEADKIAELLNE